MIVMVTIFITLAAQEQEWRWAKKGGGTSTDEGKAIAQDVYGNTYVTGNFSGTAIFGSVSLVSSGGVDVYVAKLDSGGTWLWAKKAGGAGIDNSNGIAVDNDSNVYITGRNTGSALFGTITLSSSGSFTSKLDSSGNWLWAIRGGGIGYSISLDQNSNVYITGTFNSTVSFGTYSLTSSGGTDAFIAKMDSNGNWLWAKKAGGTDNDYSYSIAVDNTGNAYVTGYFKGTAYFDSFWIRSNYFAYETLIFFYNNAYVAKIDNNGNWLWARSAMGSSTVDSAISSGYGIAVDSFSNVYFTGFQYDSTSFGGITVSGSKEMFVAKLNSSGNWIWAIGTDSSSSDGPHGYSIDVDNGGKIYVTGYFIGTTNFGSTSYTSGSRRMFVAKLDNSGNWLWVENAGGSVGNCVNVDSSGSIGIIGDFSSSTTVGGQPLISSGSTDIVVAKMGLTTIRLFSPNGGETLSASSAQNIYWDNSFSSGSVNLSLSINNGISWIALNSTPIDVSMGQLSFVVPNVASIQCLIKINWADYPPVSDISDNVFSIDYAAPSSIMLISPDNQDLMMQSSKSYNVAWISTGVEHVDIKISFNGGADWQFLAQNIDASLSFWNCTIPDTPSSNCRFLISDSENSYVYDWSNFAFTTCRLTLTSPNGGQIWVSETVEPITWNSAYIDEIKLEYRTSTTGSWILIGENISASIGNYNWVIPYVASETCFVRISSMSSWEFDDINNSTFEIRPKIRIISPNGGEMAQINSVFEISWIVAPSIVTQILIDYSIDNGINWLQLQGTAINASIGQYLWLVPNNPSLECLVRVRSASNSNIYDVSDANFSITSIVYPPTVDFIADTTSGLEQLTIQYTDLSTANTGILTEWLWDFGDGQNSTQQNPLHVYLNDGVYSVSLTATNSAGLNATLTRQDYITVVPRYPVIEVAVNSLNLGNVYLGSSSAIQELWVRNTGTADLEVSNLSFWQTQTLFEVVGALLPINIAQGDSIALQLRFTPLIVGAITDSLYIYNSSQNMPMAAIRLSGAGEYVPPKAPENVMIVMDGSNAVISWDAVTETIFDTPIVPDYYLIFFNGSADPEGVFYYHGASMTLQYTHYLVGMHSAHMFYRVIAFKNYSMGRVDQLLSDLQQGMAIDEVVRLLTK